MGFRVLRMKPDGLLQGLFGLSKHRFLRSDQRRLANMAGVAFLIFSALTFTSQTTARLMVVTKLPLQPSPFRARALICGRPGENIAYGADRSNTDKETQGPIDRMRSCRLKGAHAAPEQN